MGEKVLFLDRTMLPVQFNNRINIKSVLFCGNLWKDSFIPIEDTVNESSEMFLDDSSPKPVRDTTIRDTLKVFYDDATPKSFGEFLFALFDYYAQSSNERIWMIVDEVVIVDKH